MGGAVRVFVRFYHGSPVANKGYYKGHYYLFMGLIRPHITYIQGLLSPRRLTGTRLTITVTTGLISSPTGLTVTYRLTITVRAHHYLQGTFRAYAPGSPSLIGPTTHQNERGRGDN